MTAHKTFPIFFSFLASAWKSLIRSYYETWTQKTEQWTRGSCYLFSLQFNALNAFESCMVHHSTSPVFACNSSQRAIFLNSMSAIIQNASHEFSIMFWASLPRRKELQFWKLRVEKNVSVETLKYFVNSVSIAIILMNWNTKEKN